MIRKLLSLACVVATLYPCEAQTPKSNYSVQNSGANGTSFPHLQKPVSSSIFGTTANISGNIIGLRYADCLEVAEEQLLRCQNLIERIVLRRTSNGTSTNGSQTVVVAQALTGHIANDSDGLSRACIAEYVELKKKLREKLWQRANERRHCLEKISDFPGNPFMDTTSNKREICINQANQDLQPLRQFRLEFVEEKEKQQQQGALQSVKNFFQSTFSSAKKLFRGGEDGNTVTVKECLSNVRKKREQCSGLLHCCTDAKECHLKQQSSDLHSDIRQLQLLLLRKGRECAVQTAARIQSRNQGEVYSFAELVITTDDSTVDESF